MQFENKIQKWWRYNWEGVLVWSIIVPFIFALGYLIYGSDSRVAEIKERVPQEIQSKGWEIVRYEGWNRGSANNHGGKVYYHVKDVDNASIQYRVHVTLWGGELHWCYNDPIPLERIQIEYSTPLIPDTLH